MFLGYMQDGWFRMVTKSLGQTFLTHWKNLNSKNAISCISHDDDYLYASTMGGGIIKINKHTGEQYCIDHAQDGLPDSYVVSLAVHNHELWASNRFYGISHQSANGWNNYRSSEMGFLTDQWFHSFLFDGNSVWIGGLMALYEMRGGEIVNSYVLNPLSSYCVVNDMAIDQDHQLWLAVYDDKGQFALCQLDKNKGEVVNKCGTFGNAYALAVDEDNALWVATDQGLLRYTGQSQSLYNSSNAPLTVDKVHDVKIDRSGNIWFLTDFTLCCFNHEIFTTYSIPYSNDYLNGLDIDGDAVK